MDAREAMERERQKTLREDPLCGKKNVSGVPYDIVNLAYEDSTAGRRLAEV